MSSAGSGNQPIALPRQQPEPGALPRRWVSALCMKQLAVPPATGLLVGWQLGLSFCCAHWMSFKGEIAGGLTAALKRCEHLRHAAGH